MIQTSQTSQPGPPGFPGPGGLRYTGPPQEDGARPRVPARLPMMAGPRFPPRFPRPPGPGQGLVMGPPRPPAAFLPVRTPSPVPAPPPQLPAPLPVLPPAPNPNPVPKVSVPWGWKRVFLADKVVYFSPSGIQLKSADEIKEYLFTEGTCKCGLDCPLAVENAFDFDPQKVSEVSLPNSITVKNQGCKHLNSTLALVQLQNNTGFAVRHTHNPQLRTKGTFHFLPSHNNQLFTNIDERLIIFNADAQKKKIKKKKKPFSGVLVSQMLAAREAEKQRINEIIAQQKAEHAAALQPKLEPEVKTEVKPEEENTMQAVVRPELGHQQNATNATTATELPHTEPISIVNEGEEEGGQLAHLTPRMVHPAMLQGSKLMNLGGAAQIFGSENLVLSPKQLSRRSSLESSPVGAGGQEGTAAPRPFSLAEAMQAARRLNLGPEPLAAPAAVAAAPPPELAADSRPQQAADSRQQQAADSRQQQTTDSEPGSRGSTPSVEGGPAPATDSARNIEIRRLSSTEEGNKVLDPAFHSPEKDKQKKNPLGNLLNIVSGMELPSEEERGTPPGPPPPRPQLKGRKGRATSQFSTLPPLPHSPPPWVLGPRAPAPSPQQVVLTGPAPAPAPVMQLIQTVNGPVLVPIQQQPQLEPGPGLVQLQPVLQSSSAAGRQQLGPLQTSTAGRSVTQTSPAARLQQVGTLQPAPPQPLQTIAALQTSQAQTLQHMGAPQTLQQIGTLQTSHAGALQQIGTLQSSHAQPLQQFGSLQTLQQVGPLQTSQAGALQHLGSLQTSPAGLAGPGSLQTSPASTGSSAQSSPGAAPPKKRGRKRKVVDTAVAGPPPGPIQLVSPGGGLQVLPQPAPLALAPPGQQLQQVILCNPVAPAVQPQLVQLADGTLVQLPGQPQLMMQAAAPQLLMTPGGQLVQAVLPAPAPPHQLQPQPQPGLQHLQQQQQPKQRKPRGRKRKVVAAVEAGSEESQEPSPDTSYEEAGQEVEQGAGPSNQLASPRSSIQSNKVDSSGLNASPPHQREGGGPEYEQLRGVTSPVSDLDLEPAMVQLGRLMTEDESGDQQEETEVPKMVSSSSKKKKKKKKRRSEHSRGKTTRELCTAAGDGSRDR